VPGGFCAAGGFLQGVRHTSEAGAVATGFPAGPWCLRGNQVATALFSDSCRSFFVQPTECDSHHDTASAHPIPSQ
ncbi:MAG TPA: hypothetical protein VJV05_17235, partial [Pyrinomonadaceae bacterium]|nr:hypothetical protein [Pyrinomonadaceae bacterium]